MCPPVRLAPCLQVPGRGGGLLPRRGGRPLLCPPLPPPGRRLLRHRGLRCSGHGGWVVVVGRWAGARAGGRRLAGAVRGSRRAMPLLAVLQVGRRQALQRSRTAAWERADAPPGLHARRRTLRGWWRWGAGARWRGGWRRCRPSCAGSTPQTTTRCWGSRAPRRRRRSRRRTGGGGRRCGLGHGAVAVCARSKDSRPALQAADPAAAALLAAGRSRSSSTLTRPRAPCRSRRLTPSSSWWQPRTRRSATASGGARTTWPACATSTAASTPTAATSEPAACACILCGQ